jgi:hypothetical protein
MNFLTQKTDWQITNQFFFLHTGIFFLSYYPARNTLLFHPNPQMFASAKLPNNSLLHVVARKISSQNRS